MCKLKIPLEQIGFLQDDYQPAGYEHSSSSIRQGRSIRKGSTKAAAVTPSYNGGAAYAGGGEENRVEEGFDDDDDEYDDDEPGNGSGCEWEWEQVEWDRSMAKGNGNGWKCGCKWLCHFAISHVPQCSMTCFTTNINVLSLYFRADVGKCEVLYDYTANEPDELTIAAGDVINIVDKYDVEWWQGELNGIVGIFPASYVKDIS